MNFWEKLLRPFLVLAPMEEVTDTVFRQIVAQAGRPEVFVTEFVNVEGLDSPGAEEVAKRLKYSEIERPIAAQIWGLDPKKFYLAAKKIKEMGFDGVDINFGCPVKDVVKKGACAAMIDPGQWGRVKEIIAATQEGAGGLPVSVKTRIGVKKIITEEWIGFLLEQGLAAITVHGRTAAEASRVPAHWEEIGKAVRLRNQSKSRALIIGNGDVESYKEALEKARSYGVDGVMTGRGIFKNPWIFDKSQAPNPKSQKDRLELLIKHAKLWERTWEGSKNFAVLKKFIKMYVNGFAGASHWRAKLMQVKTPAELVRQANDLWSFGTSGKDRQYRDR